MEFLNPTALVGLLALPLLLIPYLIRKKPRRVMFSSLLLFMDDITQKSGRPFGRIHLPPIFFLQLLLLALLILALGEPVFSVRPTNIAIVLDNSASMQALESGKTRLALAQEAANAAISELGAGGKIDLYLSTPRLEKVRPAAFTPAEARSAVSNIRAYDIGDPPLDYANVLNRLAREQKYQRVHLITDHPSRGQTATIRVTTVGRTQANLALTEFDVRRSSLLNARLEANVQVKNFSDQEQKVRVILKSNGATLASREVIVGARAAANASFEGLADQLYYVAEIDAKDALPLDNRRFAVTPISRNLQILAITPRPQAALSLKSLPGVAVDVIAPEEYEKSDRTAYGLEIFHYSAPATLPQNPALFILPPGNNILARAGRPTSNASVSSWREAHTLTRYINFSLFRPAYARPLKPQTAGDVVIEGPDGVLAFASEQHGIRFLALGFDSLPYLGRDNLPMSIFTLNFLDWFFDSAGSRGRATGEPIRLASIQPGDVLTMPTGEKISLNGQLGNFSATFYQGIYQRGRGGRSEIYARNLQDASESDLRNPTTLEIQSGPSSQTSGSVLFSFWPYLLIASVMLLLIEWFANPRMASLRFRGRVRQPV